MDIDRIIDSLNDAQRLAVSAPPQPVLVLAGAGSGKTRVLVHRIAWHILVDNVSPYNILAVTFTNKAAAEMRQRVEKLLDISARAMWVGTFHGIAHRLLRRHADRAELPQAFQVIDSDDQLRLIKRLFTSLRIDEGKWPPKQAQWFINAQKDEGIRARHMTETGDSFLVQMATIYRAYEDVCERSGLVDFSELLLRAHELLRDNEDLLEFYRQRFRFVHVDEFQDTNTIQYAWLRLLTQGRDNLFVVGDDDQSIYGWRGAKIENIYSFQQHFPSHRIVRLEQNYRSTGHILAAANSVIAHNDSRLGKELWTDRGQGELISVYSAFNELDEAYFVVEKIRQWVNEGGLRSEVAILYRSNAQSRQFEEKLMATGTPYRVYGGLRFFERMEIKNALAYLRLIANRHDDASFERVVNTPPRGIGAKSMEDIRTLARVETTSLWNAAHELLQQRRLTARASQAVAGFMRLIDNLDETVADVELFEKIKIAVEHSGLIELYRKEKGDKGEIRVENLEELVNAARQFDYVSDDNQENLSELDMFLAHAALEAGDAQADDQFDDCVQLMTLHAAKGLEFKRVFLVGMEEGLFPSLQSCEEPGRLEEERRLCYVGITRAMEQLFMTHAESRRLYGKEHMARQSRFIREIPGELIQEVRIRSNVSRPAAAPGSGTATAGLFRLGQRVRHAKFGEGVVLQTEGQGAQERVQVNFSDVGLKWLMLSYAKLEAL